MPRAVSGVSRPVDGIDHLDRDVVAHDQPAEPVGDALEHAPRVERGQDRFGDLEELALAAELLLERQRLLAQPLGRVGVGHRLGREAGVDDEQPQVVVGELVEPELRQDQDAQDLVVEHHRREEHRFVEVFLRPGDGVSPRIGRGVAEDLGDPVGGDPAGDALAERDAQLVGRLVDVFADLALHRDRDELVADEAVDAGVVVVDQLAQLGRDRLADLGDARQPVQPRAELLDRLELGGPRRHPLEVLGGLDRDARLGRQRPDGVELVRRPVVRAVVVDVEQAEEVRAVHQRRRAQRVEAFLDDGRADILAARIVAVVDGEQRLEGGHRGGRQRSLREVADARDERRRQVAGHLGADVAIGMLEEDGGAVALEQDHRVVDQAGQDPVEVEPAADVGRDAAQRLRAMEQVGDLVGALGAADHRPERVRGDPGDLEVARPERTGRLADDVKDAPRLARTGDRDGQLGAAIGEDRERIARPAVEQDAGHRRRDRSGPGRRRAPGSCRGSRTDRAGRRVGSRCRPRRSRHGTRREAFAAGFPDRQRGDARRRRGGRGRRH